MQCVTPMFRRYVKGDHKDGKVVPRSEVMDILNFDENYIRNCLNKINKENRYYQYELIPCKKCWACQLNYSAEWATRIMLEAQESDWNFFITLTYDEDHIPILERIETEEKYEDTNEIVEITYHNDGTWTGSLLPKDMEKFLNSLRKHFERKKIIGIKYFYCGEYGTLTQRPHYHIILLHCPLDIELFYDTHIDGNYKAHWKSFELENYWDKGIIDVAELEWSAAAYVARYCTKKLNFSQDKRDYLSIGKLPEFVRMSKGIGMKYYEKHKHELYKNDEMLMRTIQGKIGRYKPPKAFDEKFKEEFPEAFKKIVESRKHASERAKAILEKITDYTDKEQHLIKAEAIATKMSMLPRIGEW